MLRLGPSTPGADRWISQMPESRSHSEHKAKSRHRLRTAFLIYGIMVAGLLGFLIVFPDARTHGTQDEGVQTAAKAARYQAVIANWNRYRNKTRGRTRANRATDDR